MKNEHVNENLTKNEPSFLVVIERVKQYLQATTDQAVAAALGFKSNTWANRKNSGSIPYRELVAWCMSENVSIDWALCGTGNTKREGGSALPVVAEIDGALLAQVLMALGIELAKHEAARKWLHPKWLGAVGATIYNCVVFDKTAKRADLIKREAQRTVEVWLLAETLGKLDGDHAPISTDTAEAAAFAQPPEVKKGRAA